MSEIIFCTIHTYLHMNCHLTKRIKLTSQVLLIQSHIEGEFINMSLMSLILKTKAYTQNNKSDSLRDLY